jgi:hypothetical protein
MKPKKAAAASLEKNQLWKMSDTTHIKILEVGKHLTHFKHYKTVDQKRVPIQLNNILAVQELLKEHGATLITKSHPLNVVPPATRL